MQANYPQDTTYHLEQAVKDAQKAAQLDPSDPTIKASLSKWRTELAQQNLKDRKSFKNIFQHGELYKSSEIKPAEPKGGDDALNEIQPNRAGALNDILSTAYPIGMSATAVRSVVPA